ncbi:MAG: hypothetical protein M1834_002554 [Cirrosporium novae-zelandiae]|nr:MAG: hypothetical protein M1834_002554 [Cirrosporium novae-zelandiae]
MSGCGRRGPPSSYDDYETPIRASSARYRSGTSESSSAYDDEYEDRDARHKRSGAPSPEPVYIDSYGCPTSRSQRSTSYSSRSYNDYGPTVLPQRTPSRSSSCRNDYYFDDEPTSLPRCSNRSTWSYYNEDDDYIPSPAPRRGPPSGASRRSQAPSPPDIRRDSRSASWYSSRSYEDDYGRPSSRTPIPASESGRHASRSSRQENSTAASVRGP